jgi:hypothetical protein
MTAAGLVVSVFFDINGLEAVSRAINWRNLPSELRLSHEVGLFLLSPNNLDSLNEPVRRKDFAVGMVQTFKLLGIATGVSTEEFGKLGILDRPTAGSYLSRREAVEALCRLTLFLEEKGYLQTSGSAIPPFADYAAPAKYQGSLAFLRTTGIVKGYNGTHLQPRRTLATREAIMLLYRLYEKIAAELMSRQNHAGICFVDLPLDHYLMAPLQFLHKSGAFQDVRMGPSFDGHRQVTADHMAGMVAGILKTCGPREIPAIMNELASAPIATPELSRGRLARFMAVLIDAYGPLPGLNTPVTYSDTPPGSSEALAFTRLAEAGIQLGYPNGAVHPAESVNRYEVISLLEAVLRRIRLEDPITGSVETAPAPSHPVSDVVAPGKSIPEEEPLIAEPNPDGHKYPEKVDFDEFVSLIRAKQARINQLLGRKPAQRRSE